MRIKDQLGWLRSHRNMFVLIQGGLAGILATIPMTLFIGVAHYLLPKRQRYPLPPRLITRNLAERTILMDSFERSLRRIHSPILQQPDHPPKITGLWESQ
jgi:hypothetical protein